MVTAHRGDTRDRNRRTGRPIPACDRHRVSIAIWFALVAWTFRDIEARSRSVFTQVFSTLLVVLFFVPGLLLYLILRPKETLDQAFQRALEEEYLLQDLDDLPLCPGCQRAVDPEFVLCPHCQTRCADPARLAHG